MKVHREFKQISPEWWDARRGKPSASNFHKIITPKTGKLSSQADDYMDDLIAERVCLLPNYFTVLGRPISQDMQRGIDNEPEARRYFEMIAEVNVEQVGGCETDDGRFWCSPDGLVGTEFGVEIKCPRLSTQVKYLRDNDALLDDYRCQVHGSLIVTGLPCWKLLSYSPGAPPVLLTITPDDFTKQLRIALEVFHEKYAATLKRLEVRS